MTQYTFEVDATRNDSGARSFEAYAHEYLGADESVDFEATESAYESAIAREYEKLARLPEGSVTVELYYNYPHPLGGDEYKDDLMSQAMEAAGQSNFWILLN